MGRAGIAIATGRALRGIAQIVPRRKRRRPKGRAPRSLKAVSTCSATSPDTGVILAPDPTQRTYPDFIAELTDGRIFVFEYKRTGH